MSEVLTVGQVARRFGVHPNTVAEWADKRKLPCFRTPGGHRRFREEDVDALLHSEADAPERSAS